MPEMQRSNLAPVILQLKALGIDNVLRFSFLSVSAAHNNIEAVMCLSCISRPTYIVTNVTKHPLVWIGTFRKFLCFLFVLFMLISS